MTLPSFKDYLIAEGAVDDVLNMGSKYFYHWKDKWILASKHGIERIFERSSLSKEQLKKLFKNAIERLKTIKVNLEDTVLFYSKSLEQGFISAVDREGLRLITFLPRGKQIAKDGTEKVIVESIDGDKYEVDHIMEID